MRVPGAPAKREKKSKGEVVMKSYSHINRIKKTGKKKNLKHETSQKFKIERDGIPMMVLAAIAGLVRARESKGEELKDDHRRSY